MNTFYRIVLMVAMLSFYSISWADPVPLPCEPKCTINPCDISPEKCKDKGGSLNQTSVPAAAAVVNVNPQQSNSLADSVPIDCPPHCTVDPCSPPLGPKPGCPGYPSPGPVGESVGKTQVVDPCQYGCPKEGCPKCPTGGPIGTKAKQGKAGSDHHVGKIKVKQSQQGASNPLRKVASMTCSACEANRRSCFANCNASGPAVVGGQVECIKQCQRTYQCIPNRDCQ